VPRVLVTGMSGTGKSTVLAVLAARGLRTVDTDDDGWSIEVPTPDGSALEQVWVEELMARLLSEPDDHPLVVSGTASNQGVFYDRFDAVVLLSAPTDVLLGRLASRTDNPFGKHPDELARILADIEDVQPLLRATSTLELDARRSVEELADRIDALARGQRDR
jgi:dephospho-CoA kinase